MDGVSVAGDGDAVSGGGFRFSAYIFLEAVPARMSEALPLF